MSWIYRACAFVLFLLPLQGHSQERVFGNGFEDRTTESELAAARFLSLATFGPTPTAVQQLRSQGIDAWITAQMALPPTLARPHLENLRDGGLNVAQGQRLDHWFHSAATAPDQLRQRVAFALSEIFVVSDQPDNLTNDWRGIAEYNDILLRGAFGSYRELLEQVALSPQMGKYLSHWRNRKASATSQPDENFAREIMQLFSIGLVWRHDDFSPMLDQQGQPIPTYDQAVVAELARVFTGFGNRCPDPPGFCNTFSGITSVFDEFRPMACFPLHHDTGSKQLLDLDPGPGEQRVVLPAGPSCDPAPAAGSAAQAACHAYCQSDLGAALDMLAGHPNTAPFLAQRLIQRLVTSNPSSAYVTRAAQAFRTSGGDLGALVRAILTDPEVMVFDPARADFALPPSFGKLREPLLRVTALWRAFGAQPGICSGNCLDQSNPPPGLSEIRMGIRAPQRDFFQRPFGANSVFNFFSPDHPLGNTGILAPELQILDETSTVILANELWFVIWAGYNSGTGNFTTPSLRAWLPPPQIDGLPTDSIALVNELDRRLLYGTMSGELVAGNCEAGSGLRGALYRLLQCRMANAEHRRRALGAIHLIAISPDFAVQR